MEADPMQEKDSKAPARPTAGDKPASSRPRDGADAGRATPVDEKAQREAGRERAADRGYD
jgi:hypothetical protein